MIAMEAPTPLAVAPDAPVLDRGAAAPRSVSRVVRILGTRGIPGRHGGFESFAEDLSLYLASRGWTVIVYCQEEGPRRVWEDSWRGISRVHIASKRSGPLATILFDLRSTWHALARRDLALVFGYNTALFGLAYRVRRMPSVMNMDGLEWRRRKWNRAVRVWFWVNEWIGARASSHLVADHPEIARHLVTRTTQDRITMIPYGCRAVAQSDPALLAPLNLEPFRFVLAIARPEPENSLLEIVRAYSAAPRRVPLVVLGALDPSVAYHRRIRAAAAPTVRFPGAIYDRPIVDALRRFALVYLHGHTIGGTNPSLLEALGAGTPVVAHDNAFNRWVAGEGARYFGDEHELKQVLDRLLDPAAGDELGELGRAARARHAEAFRLEDTLPAYERLLSAWQAPRASEAS